MIILFQVKKAIYHITQKKNVKIIKLDISKDKNLSEHFKGANYVFHLAGLAEIIPSIKDPARYFINNTLGTLNILEATKKVKINKFIYAASSSCYGKTKKIPTKETDIIDATNPYSLTKFLGEELVIKYAKLYDMPNISLRFFNVYGPRLNTKGKYGAVFSIFLKQKKANKSLTIVGNGRQTRDFIYVDDLIDAFFKIMKSNLKNKIYNLGSGKETSINKIASLIGGKKIFIPEIQGETKRSCANISMICKDVNWKPKISISEGIKKLFNN